MKKITGLILIIISVLNIARGKEQYAIANFTRDNGFPGNKIYSLYQDAQDYLWIGTENGLVRYNGYEFKTFTTKDGLPDNEVLGMTADHQGRLWIVSFSHEICYLYNGKVYNRHNDSFVAQIKLSEIAHGPFLDKWSNIWVIEKTSKKVFILTKERKIRVYNNIDGVPFNMRNTTIKNLSDGTPLVFNQNKLYHYNKDHFELIAKIDPPIYEDGTAHLTLMSHMLQSLDWSSLATMTRVCKGEGDFYWKGLNIFNIRNVSRVAEDVVAISTMRGFFLKNIRTNQCIDSFFNGWDVSWSIRARDSSLWVGTLGHGLFHFTPSNISTVDIGSYFVFFIGTSRDEVYFIADKNKLVQARIGLQKTAIVTSISAWDEKNKTTDIRYISKNAKGEWIYASGGVLFKTQQFGKKPLDVYNHHYFKTFLEEGEPSVLIGTLNGIFRLDKDRFVITDTLYHLRVTSVAKLKNKIYAGTLTGLIEIGPEKRFRDAFPGYSELATHITAVYADSLLWVANNRAVLTVLKNDSVVATIDGHQSFVCNTISVLKASDRFMWVGTDNGLFALKKDFPYNVVKHYSKKNGLNGNQIECIDIANGMVWTGTDKGVNYLDEQTIVPQKDESKFFITSIQNEDTLFAMSRQTIRLSHATLQINFDVVDQSGILKPDFAYCINSGRWTPILDKSLYFPTLPYGSFTVSLKAFAPNWSASKTLTLSFYREYPFYLKWWFVILAALLLLALIAGTTKVYVRRIRRKDQEKLSVQKNLLQLEQMALQGQMNPHFVFNCITAIRQYYNKGDLQKANRFVDTFTCLIRNAFEMSNHTFVTLEKELNYLEAYLKIEQERFNHSFSFFIIKNVANAPSEIPVPVMLLQPLAENAVRHGVRHLPDGEGIIKITVTQEDDIIHIIIEDNGLGRAKTLAMKRENIRIRPPVTSTSVNERRMAILNKLFEGRLSMSTEDRIAREGEVSGTVIRISYPINIYDFRQ